MQAERAVTVGRQRIALTCTGAMAVCVAPTNSANLYWCDGSVRVCVCVCVLAHACARVRAHACVRDMFTIYDNNI